MPGTSLDALISFCALAETDTMEEAGRRCGKVQTAISHHVLSLERALGVKLFNRRLALEKGRLTEAGELVYEAAWRALRELDELEAGMADFRADGSRKTGSAVEDNHDSKTYNRRPCRV